MYALHIMDIAILCAAVIYAARLQIIVNPPFRTIKGMPLEQKDFLQQFYPMSKCDMCNAFIERVMEVLPEGGKAAMVTQNSWMYEDTARQGVPD